MEADLVLVDLNRKVQLTDALMASKRGWTPFDGRAVTGFPLATVLRGKLIIREGELSNAPRGRVVQVLPYAD